MDLIESDSNAMDYAYLAKQLYPDLEVDHFENCTNLKVSSSMKENFHWRTSSSRHNNTSKLMMKN